MIIGNFVKQYKGKDIGKVKESKLVHTGWFVGIKYDGNYIQVHKKGNLVRFFTSDGIEIYIKELADELRTIGVSFIIEAEFNNNSTGLKLNDRRKSSTGTAIANFKKGIETSMPNSQLRVFNILNWNNADIRGMRFQNRVGYLSYFNTLRIKGVDFRGSCNINQVKEFARGLISQGGEGAFAFNGEHTIIKNVNTERSNLAIKVKANKKSKMICIGAKESDTVENEWGALELQDENSNIQFFGGLPNSIRKMYPKIPLKELFEVRYESFTKGKYVQGFINAS